MHGVESLKAIASSASISGWVIWRDMAFIWAAIIAVSQLLDAVKGVFPFARHHKAASDLTVAMETIYIEAEHEWEAIHAGKMTSDEINDRRMKLRKLQLAAEVRHFPEGFNPSTRIKKVATKAAIDYIHLTFHMDASA